MRYIKRELEGQVARAAKAAKQTLLRIAAGELPAASSLRGRREEMHQRG